MVVWSCSLLPVSDRPFASRKTFKAVPASGTYYIRVYFYDAGNTYDLWWDDTLSDDNYEENDTIGAAYNITSSENVWVYGVQYDSDCYVFYYDGPEYLIVDLEFSHSAGDIDLELYNSAGTLVDWSRSSTDNENITYGGAAGWYYIRVYGYPDPPNNTGNTYRVKWVGVIG